MSTEFEDCEQQSYNMLTQILQAIAFNMEFDIATIKTVYMITSSIDKTIMLAHFAQTYGLDVLVLAHKNTWKMIAKDVRTYFEDLKVCSDHVKKVLKKKK